MPLLTQGVLAQPARSTQVGCLHELFERQADVRPEQVALVYGDVRLTYEQLDERANQLAHHLRGLGVGPGKLVGLYLHRSEKHVTAILAVLKAGAGYVPIDPIHPAERARHIVTEAGIEVLLTEDSLAARAAAFCQGDILSLDGSAAEIDRAPVERLSREETGVSPSDLCYVLYTSGTTGKPKGVMTEHRNVVRFVAAFNEVVRLDATDRVFHGFSLGFDGSVEEMWMAFSNGATLVVGTSDVVKFGDEVARVFCEEGVTVFSTVPTFLSMIGQDLPTVRLIIVSGEPCPPDLVKKWARTGRRLLNVYGPTETTVNTTAAECLPGKPVTIGRPLRGYQTWVLDENMRPVRPGQPGELYIGGVGVARGYFNQPELTTKQFVPDPFQPGNGRGEPRRLYRTGDLVSATEDGELLFLRRIDHQVKVRGFRIELSEIESVLREHPMVAQAVVNVFDRDGLRELAAWVVARQTKGEQHAFDRDGVLQWLRDRLPPYMVPGYLDLLEEIPALASGKADRSRLPEPRTPLVPSGRTVVGPRNETERKIAETWRKVFQVESISCDADFFLDLAGYSLVAAQVVSLLRAEHGWEVAIRDVYRHPTVQKLAAHLTAPATTPKTAEACESPTRRSSREVFESLSCATRWTCWGLQGLVLGVSYGAASLPFLGLVFLVLAVIGGSLSLTTLLVVLAAVGFLETPARVVLAIALKWLVIGRFRPGSYPVWGFYYFRWWLTTRIQAFSGIGGYAGTPIMSLYYRLMGAKVGRNCLIDTPSCAIFDLVTIGDDTSIGAQTHLLGYHVEDGMLVIGTVEIGSRCFVGTHSALGVNTKMEDDSYLDDLSLLPDGATMKSGEARRGSPAERVEMCLPEVGERSARRRPILFGLAHWIAAGVVGDLLMLASLPPLALVLGAYLFLGLAWAAVTAVLAIPLGVVSFCVIVAGLKALIMRRTKPGVYPVESWVYLRRWTADRLLAASGRIMSTVYTTIYLPPWLRLLGAKIGRRAEISTVTQMTPDLTIIDDESFFADGSMIGGRRLFRGHIQLDWNRIGRRSFVGNNALLPLGASLGDNCLLGVLSAPPGAAGSRTPDGTEWLGSPPFQLPHRKKVGGFDVSQTYKPTLKLYALRCLIDAMRILVPILIGLAAFAAEIGYLVAALKYLPAWATWLTVPVVGTAIALCAALSVVVMKKVVMGTFRPVIKPLWSVYVWLNEALNGAYEAVGAPILAPTLGTPFFAWYLRLMGCKVGKHCFLETTLFSEFDLVEIGDYAALNAGVVVQNHLFEDRIMKSSYLKIGDECSVGNLSVVLYDSQMKRGSSIGSLSLLMKGETLPEETRWLGIPTRQV
jgi:non-ribosomal peptide synthetase-like protein